MKEYPSTMTLNATWMVYCNYGTNVTHRQ